MRETALLVRRDGVVTLKEMNEHIRKYNTWTTEECVPEDEDKYCAAVSAETALEDCTFKTRKRTFKCFRIIEQGAARIWVMDEVWQ